MCSFCTVWENSRLSSSSLLAAGETLLAARSDSRRYGCFRRLAFAKQYLKVFWLTVSFKTTYSLDSTSIPVIISYPSNATRSHTLLERGFLMSYRLQKWKIKLFPLPSPLCNFVPLFELPVENNKYPNFEWRGGGRGVDSFVLKLPYLKMKGDFDWSCKDIWKISGLSPLLLLSQSVHFFFFKSPLP